MTTPLPEDDAHDNPGAEPGSLAPAATPSRPVRVFRRGVIVIYWIVLPIAVLMTLGWILTAAQDPSSWRHLLGAAAMFVFTAAVAWRLWLNRRATGLAGAPPSGSRLLKTYLPLGLLALVGLSILALGVLWITLSAALLHYPEFGDTDSLSQPSAGVLIVVGAVVAMIGAALCWPFARLLTRRQAPAPAPAPATEAAGPAE